MKLFYLSIFAMLGVCSICSNAFVFVTPSQQQHQPSTHHAQQSSTITGTSLSMEATTTRKLRAVAHGAFMGWFLATRIASASIAGGPLTESISESVGIPNSNRAFVETTTMIAAGAYLPETSFESLDMKMPVYNVQSDVKPNIDGNEGQTDKPSKSFVKPDPKPRAPRSPEEEERLQVLQEKQRKVQAEKDAKMAEINAIKAERSREKAEAAEKNVAKTRLQKDSEEEQKMADLKEKQSQAKAQKEANIAEVKAARQKAADEAAAKKGK